ncbi:MAG: acyl-CoA dehydrogenase family protein [Candidatus Binatia bacterium]
MDFAFSDDQRAIRDLAERIFQDHVTPKRLLEVEAGSEGIDRELWRRLAEASLLGAALPERVGGSGLGLFELCLVLEQAGRRVAPVPLVPAVVLAALPIATFGSGAQQAAYLPRLAAGETLLSAALVEEGGSDPMRPRTTARRDGAAWRLDGEKHCVPIGRLAERVLVPARTADGVGVFLLDPAASGVSCERQRATNREPLARLTLAGARVDGTDLLGTPAEGAAIVHWIAARAALALCAVQLGVAEEAVRLTAEYTATRQQFGRPIGSFQGVALRAADAYIDVEAMRSVLWEAAWRVGEGRPAAGEIATATWWACTAGQRVVHTAQHLHGGIGADVDYPIHRYFLWAKQIELALGGAGRQLARLGAELPSL